MPLRKRQPQSNLLARSPELAACNRFHRPSLEACAIDFISIRHSLRGCQDRFRQIALPSARGGAARLERTRKNADDSRCCEARQGIRGDRQPGAFHPGTGVGGQAPAHRCGGAEHRLYHQPGRPFSEMVNTSIENEVRVNALPGDALGYYCTLTDKSVDTVDAKGPGKYRFITFSAVRNSQYVYMAVAFSNSTDNQLFKDFLLLLPSVRIVEVPPVEP